MKKVESYVKRWYDYLEEGKLMGTLCKKCGAVEFPPLPICNTCGAHDMEWVEMDGEGTLLGLSAGDMPMLGPEMGLVACGAVMLKENVPCTGLVVGLTEEEKESMFDRVPVKVKMDIMQRDGYKYFCFRLAE